MPSLSGRHTGMPIGQPNSTVLMSSPIRFRSSRDNRLFSHSRTGSPPASVRKKMAVTRLPAFSFAGAGAASTADTVFPFTATALVYRIRYTKDVATLTPARGHRFFADVMATGSPEHAILILIPACDS